MADALGVPGSFIVGALVVLWSLADIHSTNGKLPGVTPSRVDKNVDLIGFAAQAIRVDWLREDGAGGVVIPRFGEHNGKSAKKRAQTAKRVQRCRNAASVTGSVTRALSRAEQEQSRARADEEQKNPAMQGGSFADRSALLACPAVRDALRLCRVSEPALSELSACPTITVGEIADIWEPIAARRRVVNKPGTLVAQLKKNHHIGKTARTTMRSDLDKTIADAAAAVNKRRAEVALAAREEADKKRSVAP